MPKYYESNNVGVTGHVPNVLVARQEGIDLGVAPFWEDKRKVLLLLVDPQIDFIHEDGNLAVPGAVDDTRRTVEFINQNVDEITQIAASLDTHIPTQIFFSSWWEDEYGEEPAPFTNITTTDVDNEVWMPRYEVDWSKGYVHKLDLQAKKDLTIWPYHTLTGTQGHNVSPVLYEAIMYHAGARQADPTFLHKGSIAKTEHYSLLEPEVKVPEAEDGGVNTIFVDFLREFDLIYVAGQAKSHCVLETLASILRLFGAQSEIAKLRILTDCMSTIPGYEKVTDAAYAGFVRQGAVLVKSTDPIG